MSRRAAEDSFAALRLIRAKHRNYGLQPWLDSIAAPRLGRTMTIVEQVRPSSKLGPEYSRYKRDTITLPWEERRQGHGRRRSDSGIEFAISLPEGTVLKNGDCFVLDPEEAIVAIQEAAQPVYVIRPKTSQEWAFYAYHVGNRHQSVMIGETELIFPENPAVRSLLDQLHVEYTTDARPFTAALANIGHAHDHK
jgi:urease accessory protein